MIRSQPINGVFTTLVKLAKLVAANNICDGNHNMTRCRKVFEDAQSLKRHTAVTVKIKAARNVCDTGIDFRVSGSSPRRTRGDHRTSPSCQSNVAAESDERGKDSLAVGGAGDAALASRLAEARRVM